MIVWGAGVVFVSKTEGVSGEGVVSKTEDVSGEGVVSKGFVFIPSPLPSMRLRQCSLN